MAKQYKVLPGRYREISKVSWFPFIWCNTVYFVQDEETGRVYIERLLLRERLGEYITTTPSGFMDEESGNGSSRYCGALIPISRK